MLLGPFIKVVVIDEKYHPLYICRNLMDYPLPLSRDTSHDVYLEFLEQWRPVRDQIIRSFNQITEIQKLIKLNRKQLNSENPVSLTRNIVPCWSIKFL